MKAKELYVNYGYQIKNNGEIALNDYLDMIGLCHKIKEEYTEEELLELEDLLYRYYLCGSRVQLNQMTQIASDWWRNELVNPTLQDLKLWKTILLIISCGNFTKERINSIETMNDFSKQFKSRLLEQLLLKNEVELNYPTVDKNILTDSLKESNYKHSKRYDMYMQIKENRIQVVKDGNSFCLYYNYQKINAKKGK